MEFCGEYFLKSILQGYQHFLCKIQRSVLSWWCLCWWEGEWPVKDTVWVPAQKGAETTEVQWEELTLFKKRHPDLIGDILRGRQKATPPLSLMVQSSAPLISEIPALENQWCTVTEVWWKCSGGLIIAGQAGTTQIKHRSLGFGPYWFVLLGLKKSHWQWLESEQHKGVGCALGCRTDSEPQRWSQRIWVKV